jgi:hypothetical protein
VTNTHHAGLNATEVSTRSEYGLTLDDLRQFLTHAEGLQLPGKTRVTVGGLREYANIHGERWWWVNRVQARHITAAKRLPGNPGGS